MGQATFFKNTTLEAYFPQLGSTSLTCLPPSCNTIRLQCCQEIHSFRKIELPWSRHLSGSSAETLQPDLMEAIPQSRLPPLR